MTNQVASPASKPEPPDPAPTAQATNHVSEAAFELTMKPKGDYAVGKASDLAIVLTAKAPFHVNDKYPYKFTLNKVDGVAFESDVVKGDRVKLDEKQATMTVPFTPNAKGAKTISGRFSFSVCTDEKCLIEKRELAAEINVQ